MMDEKKEKKPARGKSSEKSKGYNKKVAVLVAALCAAALIVGGFSAYSAAYSYVLPGVTVEGTAVGGLSQTDVERKLELEYEDKDFDRTVKFVCGNNYKEVSFSDIGLKIDSKKIAEDAFLVGRSSGTLGKIFAVAVSLFSKKEIPLSVVVDNGAFESVISEVAGEFEKPMTETTYTVEDNTLTILKGKGGEVVNREKTLQSLAEALVKPDISEIELIVERAEPKEVDPDEFYEKLTQPPKDAEYRLEDGIVVVVPEKPKVIVDKKAVEAALKSKDSVSALAVEVEYPEKRAEELEAMLFRDVLGSYSSSFASSSASRASNVSLTAQRVNGYILMPGDEFSYDKTVGRRTAANGYKEAGVYVGNKVESGIGGGICQTSSTLYSAALYADLEIVQRTSHSLPVSYVPGGMDATIAEGYIDLKLRNNTEYPVKLVAVVNGRRLTCQVLGVKDPDKSVEIINTKTADHEPKVERTTNAEIPEGYKKTIAKGAPGYNYATKRVVSIKGKVVKEERMTGSVYRAASTEIEVNPADKETPPEELREYDEEEYKKEQEALKNAEAKQPTEETPKAEEQPHSQEQPTEAEGENVQPSQEPTEEVVTE